MTESWKNVKTDLVSFDSNNKDIVDLILKSQNVLLIYLQDLKKELKVTSVNQDDVSVTITALW